MVRKSSTVPLLYHACCECGNLSFSSHTICIQGSLVGRYVAGKKTSSSYHNDTRANMEIFYKQRDINNSTMHLHMYIRRFPPLDQRHKSNPLLPLYFSHTSCLKRRLIKPSSQQRTNGKRSSRYCCCRRHPSLPSLPPWKFGASVAFWRLFLLLLPFYSLLCMFFLLFLSARDKNVPVRAAIDLTSC